MNVFALAHSPEPNAMPPVQQIPRKPELKVPGDQLQKQEADRLFEAGVQWFLAVSRAA